MHLGLLVIPVTAGNFGIAFDTPTFLEPFHPPFKVSYNSVDEVNAEEVQNQTSKYVVRKRPKYLSDKLNCLTSHYLTSLVTPPQNPPYSQRLSVSVKKLHLSV
jgi:hypothetical protein